MSEADPKNAMMLPVEHSRARDSSAAGAPSFFDLLTPVVRRWRLIVGLPLTTGVGGVLLAFLLPPAYTAKTTFIPAVGTGSSLPPGLSGLVGQLGVTLGNANSLSPDFFAEVLRSRELLEATLLSSFDDPSHHGAKRPLLDLLAQSGKTEQERLDNGVRYVEDHISQRVDRRTGIVTLAFVARWSTLAADVANRMVELLDKFNLERLRSQSGARRRFAGERLAQAEAELHQAEAAHLRFLQSNRRYSDSPLLSFEENRLARQVQLRQEVFVTLTREFEEARIAEVRDTPLLTIIDPAVPPDRRSSPHRKLIVALLIIAGELTALALVFFREWTVSEGSRGSGYGAFLHALRTAGSELRGALSLTGRRR